MSTLECFTFSWFTRHHTHVWLYTSVFSYSGAYRLCIHGSQVTRPVWKCMFLLDWRSLLSVCMCLSAFGLVVVLLDFLLSICENTFIPFFSSTPSLSFHYLHPFTQTHSLSFFLCLFLPPFSCPSLLPIHLNPGRSRPYRIDAATIILDQRFVAP